MNFPLDYINNNMSRINYQDTYFIHCRSGYRSLVAASILKARGFHNIVDIAGGWKDMEQTDLAMTDYACPTSIAQEVIDEAVEAVV